MEINVYVYMYEIFFFSQMVFFNLSLKKTTHNYNHTAVICRCCAGGPECFTAKRKVYGAIIVAKLFVCV